MAEEIRPTRATRRVLLVLLTGAPELGGYTIGHMAGVGWRTYSVLHRLERAGWVSAEWEGAWPAARPRRRYYRLTRQGWAKATQLLGLPPDDASHEVLDPDIDPYDAESLKCTEYAVLIARLSEIEERVERLQEMHEPSTHPVLPFEASGHGDHG